MCWIGYFYMEEVVENDKLKKAQGDGCEQTSIESVESK